MSKTCLFQAQYAASLDRLVAEFGQPQYQGACVEMWTFDGPERRQGAETRLRELGVEARVRSAYKPMLHALLEEADLSDLERITIHYPVLADLPDIRFLLEMYPVSDILPDLTFHFVPAPSQDNAIHYRVVAPGQNDALREWQVFAPNQWRDDLVGKPTVTPCGWIRVSGAQQPDLNRDEMFVTDLEQAFHDIMRCLQGQIWKGDGPYFKRLEMKVTAPFFEKALPILGALDKEWISSAEMLHEEIYFSALELLKAQNGLDAIERMFGPGQLVPITEISKEEKVSVEVSLATDPHLAKTPLEVTVNRAKPPQDAPLNGLDTATHWLDANTVKACLDALGGDAIDGTSRCGRPVWSRHFASDGPGLLITAGQHANETSGTIGALRAARKLVANGTHNLLVTPQINPDGFALFEEYCQTYPHHMNHAARFTAGGNDLEYMARSYENEPLYQGKDLTKANLHLNLHGYPSHEWNRPFNGYIPRGYGEWMLPKGFVLILRYHPDWKQKAKGILERVVDQLHLYQPLIDLNKEQLARYQRFVPNAGFELMGDIPCYLLEWPEGLCPITIVTEAPDETIYGDAFVVQHTAQMLTTLSAADAIA